MFVSVVRQREPLLSSVGCVICEQLDRRPGSSQALQTQTMANQGEDLAGMTNTHFKRHKFLFNGMRPKGFDKRMIGFNGVGTEKYGIRFLWAQ